MIPRPWLNKNRELEKVKTASLEILDKPTWNVSWSKLSSCFCIREQSDDERHNSFRDASQFPTFPAIRRDSSASLSSSSSPDLEDVSEDSHARIYSWPQKRVHFPHPDVCLFCFSQTGSLSSFTASDSSSLSSLEEAYFQSPGPQMPPARPRASPVVSAATPPPPTGKPPITMRCRSPALPPRGSSVTNTKFPAPRARCDTGEYSKTSTNTNNSRHRRLDHFTFSGDSIDRILNGAEEKGVPPPVVMCQGTRRPYQEESEDGGYVSQLDDDDQEDLDYEEFWKKLDNEDDDNSHSPFSQLERKTAKEQEEVQQLATPSLPPIPKQQPAPDPVYLCKSERLDRSSKGRVILSGWVAASVGDNSLEVNLRSGSKLRLKDIYYMRIVEDNDQASLVLHNCKGEVAHLLRPEMGWSCLPKEISSRVGRSVLLNDPSGSTVATLLPVSLNDCFFSRGELVSSKQFSKLHSQLFANGSGKVYAPDEQHDAAMFIMFSMDALIKGCGR